MVCVISSLFHRFTGIYGKINYICLTEFNKQKLLQLKQIKEEKIYIKPNYMDSMTIYSKEDYFVYAGRLDELKGIKILFEAWAQMGANAPRLIVCGTGPLEDWCKDKAIGLNIQLMGFVENTKVKDIIGHSRALILPTLWYEGFPMSIVEAYSAGTPVICSDFGNTGRIVYEGITGWKFEIGSIEGLVKAVNKWEDISCSVKRIYEEKYTAESNYQQLLSIYSTVRGVL
jgi:glycosyltransferase involved in cell wall biosynthesis